MNIYSNEKKDNTGSNDVLMSVPKELPSIAEQDYLKSLNVRKRIGRTGLAGLVAAELTVAGMLTGEVVTNDYQTRIVNEVAIQEDGYIEYASGKYRGETDFGYLEGLGTFSFSSGVVYTGEFDNNQMSGLGSLYVPTEGTYEGEFCNSMKHGNGTYKWEDGTTYVGEWSADKMYGQGEYISSTEVKYSGSFIDNFFYEGLCTFENVTGNYMLTYVNGSIEFANIAFTNGVTYSGECSLEGLNGEGTMTFPNGESYSGTFIDGVRSGQGIYTWESGDTYDGEWSDDKMNGSGTYKYFSGSYAAGTFDSNKFTDGNYYIENDFGKYTFTIAESEPYAISMILENGTTYEGDIKDDMLSGNANIKYENGDKYSGSVIEGMKSGQGIYTWTSGASYDGKWSEDQMNGSGIYMYPSSEDGYKLTGTFSNGKPDGECQYYTTSTTHYKTDWKKGKCVKIYE